MHVTELPNSRVPRGSGTRLQTHQRAEPLLTWDPRRDLRPDVATIVATLNMAGPEKPAVVHVRQGGTPDVS